MDDKDAIIALNKIIQNAQQIIQQGGTEQQVWNALYIPPGLRYVRTPMRISE